LPQPETSLISTPHGVELECLITGLGDPATVFAHGLANGIAETRPLGSAVTGRRVFFQFRGHGRSAAPPGRWTYADLARDLRAVADLTGATRALGVSMGAAALCHLLADHPDRFERVVLFLPAVLDTPRPKASRERLTGLLEAIDAGDAAQVASVLSQDIPATLRNNPATWSFLRQRMDLLMSEGLAPELASVPEQAAIADRTKLASVSAPVLVIGCLGDDLHPTAVAEDLAAILPQATLHIYDKPGVLWTQRADLRDRIATFFNR
jgi:pimeloyl-ACP methyl ester carboxylesterase